MSLVNEIMGKLNRFNPTPLERKQLGELAKKGKPTPPTPKRKKARVEEFKFGNGVNMLLSEIGSEYTPGGIIQFGGTPPVPGQVWGRRTGNPFFQEYTRVNNAKANLAIEMIKQIHGVRIELVPFTGGDYTEFICMEGSHQRFRISNTLITTATLGDLVVKLEYAFGLKTGIDPTKDRDIKQVKEKTDERTAAEKWADEWANKTPTTEDARDESTPDTPTGRLGYPPGTFGKGSRRN